MIAIATSFAPIQANMFHTLINSVKSISQDAREVADDFALKVKKNTWDAKILGYPHSGKILTSAALAALVADQAYGYYHNSKFRATKEYKKLKKQALQDNPHNAYKEEYEYLPQLYKTLSDRIQERWYKVPPKIRYAVEDIASYWRYIAAAVIINAMYQKIMMEQQTGSLIPNNLQIVNKENITDTFDSIIGLNDVKQDIRELIDQIKDPNKYQKLFKNKKFTPIPGFVLYGEPGTAKTTFARATAKMLNADFAILPSSVNGVFRGTGSLQVNTIKQQAKESAKNGKHLVVFIDEIDSAIGKSNDMFTSTDNNATTNSFKALIDGFIKIPNLTIIGATNHLEKIDPAMLRPGRLSPYHIATPTKEDYTEIIASTAAQMTVDSEINPSAITNETYQPGDTGAKVNTLFEMAARIAGFNDKAQIDQDSINAAMKRMTTQEVHQNKKQAGSSDILETLAQMIAARR